MSCALCHCCQQNVCLVHLNEHNNLLHSHLDRLVVTVNTIRNRLQTINTQMIIDANYQKLEQWRLDSHKRIDRFFQQKCRELNRLIVDKVDEQDEEFNRLQTKVAELINEQHVTCQDIHELTSTVDQLEIEINNIEESFIQIYTHPLVLDNGVISIKGVNDEEYDLSVLSSAYKFISRPNGSYGALASNDRNLLIHQAPYLCLVDQDLTIHKRILWRYGLIHDMCWSRTLDRFIVIDRKNLFFLNENTGSTEKVQPIQKRNWLSCTCSDQFLFLSTNEWGSSITKFSFTSSKKLDQQWESPKVCRIDEYVDVVTCNKTKLAMIIRNNSSRTTRIEVRSSETLDWLWSLPLDLVWNPRKPFHCCSFINEGWLIADYESGRLLHITKTRGVKSTIPYNKIPYCVTLFGSNRLAVSAKDGVNFHDLNYRKTYTIFVF